MRIISVCNQKGGCGKTTTVMNIASEIAKEGKKVLMIDADYQGNLTAGLGINNNQKTLLNCFNGEVELKDIIIKGELIENLDIVPCSERYADFNMAFAQVKNNTTLLKRLIEKSNLHYDYIIIDCSPSLDLTVVNNLATSDKIIVTMEPSLYNIQGLTSLIKTVKLIKKSLNKTLEIGGILLTRVDTRTKLSQEVREMLQPTFGKELFDIEIHQSSVVPRSQLAGLPLCMYDNKSKVSKQYEEIAKEILKW